MDGRVVLLLAVAALLTGPAQGYRRSKPSSSGQCPVDKLGPLVRCAGISEECTSNSDCPSGQGCCRRVCARACFPVCQPECDANHECLLPEEDSPAAVCTPLPQPQCPYDDLGPRIRCAGPVPDDCSSNSQCPSGQACCFRGCNKSCQPACQPPCPSHLQCRLNVQLGASSCQTPLSLIGK